MATVSPSRIPAQTQERISSPLQQLRGAIRRYIVLEAVAVFLILLSLWYWVGLGLDYGTFKLTGFDYVQLIPHWFRWAVLVGIVAVVAILVTLNLVRLARTFRNEALALVLERRFPKLLGDRLITAVELADLDDAEAHGYSRAMILKTVDEVSRDVDQISIREVFNWGRIKWLYGLLVVLSVVLFFGSMAGDFIAHRSANPVHFAHRQWDRSSIWFERNILIWDTLWPRRAYLELVDFPASGELRIGRDAPSPRIRARALKWVTADRSATDGWRALTWADLTPKLLGGRAAPALPAALLVPPSMANSAPAATDPYWTLDRVEMLLDTAEVRERLLKSGMSEPDYTALRDTFEALNATADDPAMSRTMRRLIIPRDVTLYYWGQKSDNNMPLTRQQDANEYTAVVTDLKESVKFYVKGEDFVTSNRTITLVPPPMLTRLERDEYVPAYHYHRPPAGKAEDLKGLKQKRAGLGTSLTGSTSRIEIESGSDMTLRGEVDKDLTEVRIRYRTQKADDKPAPPGGWRAGGRRRAGRDPGGQSGRALV